VEQILAAIQAAAAGESHHSPRIAADILDRVRTDAGGSALPDEARAELTEREREVLRLMAEGKASGSGPAALAAHASGLLLPHKRR
jgi:DNA-binding NarL/FixJ family response regulator